MTNPLRVEHIHTTPAGVEVRVFTEWDAVFAKCKHHYDTAERLNMDCPFCGDDLWGNNLTYEREDGEFKDTYTCDVCDVLITLITPARYTEYWQVPDGAERYEIEFMWGGEPSTWEDGKEPING